MPVRSRRIWPVLGLVAAAATVSASLTSASAAPVAPQPVTLAHLRLTLQSNSDWTQVQLRPGTVVSKYVASSTGSGTPAGLGVKGATGPSTQTVDLVYSDTSSAPTFQIEVDKGYVGATAVLVSNVNNGTATPVAYVVDTVHSPSDGSNHVVQTVSRTALMGTTPIAQPHADARRLVLAFYYPWSFGTNYNDPHLADRPANPRNVWNPGGVASMTAQAKAHGVDGFIVSWGGEAADGAAFDTALNAAENQQQVITGYLETPRATATRGGPVDPAVVQARLAQLLQRSDSPAFLKASDGVPVVFVYQMSALPAAQWDAILANLHDAGQDVHLVGDATDASYLSDEWGLHRYAVNQPASTLANWAQNTSLLARGQAIVNPAAAPKLFAGTASPGSDDQALRGLTNAITPRAGGATYTATWNAALSAQPDWVLVTSWNEWYEGTAIEPGVANGSSALNQTAALAAAWRNQP